MKSPISEHILFQILKELPAKTLLRFKCLSKNWCTMIEDPSFVELHRIHSHHRPGGITIFARNVIQTTHASRFKFCLVNLEGNLLPLPDPRIPIDGIRLTDSRFAQSVEGLVCLGHSIWNPSTRKIIYLPPQYVKINVVTWAGYSQGSYRNRFSLGFDASINKHKVLSICKRWTSTNDACDEVEWNREEQTYLFAQIFTLGSNSWRQINIPKELNHEKLELKEYCYVNNIIYWWMGLDRPRSSSKVILAAFELQNEKIRVMPLPDDVLDPYKYIIRIFEMDGRLGMIDNSFARIWVLEDYQSAKWKKVNLVLPKSWIENSYSKINCCPIGSTQNGQILFKAENSPRNSLSTKDSTFFCFYYDVEREIASRDSKIPPKLMETIYSKHVETIIPLE